MRIPALVEFIWRECPFFLFCFFFLFSFFVFCLSPYYGWPYLTLWAVLPACGLHRTLCIYLHFKIVLNKFRRLADNKDIFPPFSQVSTGDRFLNCQLFWSAILACEFIYNFRSCRISEALKQYDLAHGSWRPSFTESPSKFDGECNYSELHLEIVWIVVLILLLPVLTSVQWRLMALSLRILVWIICCHQP